MIKIQTTKLAFLGLLAGAVISNNSFALTASEITSQKLSPEAMGLAIIQEADSRDQGWGNSSADMEMTLKNKQGKSSVRQMTNKAWEITDPNDGDWGLMVFNTPRDVKGTASLTYSHIEKADDQWLYLPALKRVKRISSKNKSGPFVGSEFAFEDLSSQEVAKYTYKYLAQDACETMQCFKVELKPTYKFSGYTKLISWVDTEHFKVRKTEFYDRKGLLLKTLELKGYREYVDKYWRPHDMFMQNHRSGKSTRITWGEFKFNDPNVTEKNFSKAALKRVR